MATKYLFGPLSTGRLPVKKSPKAKAKAKAEVKKADVKKLRDDITLLGKGQTQLRKGLAEVLGTVSKVEDQMGPAVELVNKTRAELTKLRRDPSITVPGHLDKKMAALEAELKKTKEKLSELVSSMKESNNVLRQSASLLADRIAVVEAGNADFLSLKAKWGNILEESQQWHKKQMDALSSRLDELESIVQTQQEAIDELTEPDDEPKPDEPTPDESKQVTLDEAIQRAALSPPEEVTK